MPLTRLTLEERIRLVRFFSVYEKASSIQKAWLKQFGTDPPSRKTIAALNKKFDETGSVADLTRTGRPKTSRTEEKIALVQNAIRSDPTKSIRILSSELGLNKASVHRIKQDTDKQGFLKQENKRLKEKIHELQRRIDILEGRKPSLKNAKKGRGNNIFLVSDYIKGDIKPTGKPMPYLLSRTNTQDSEPKFELVRVEDEHGERLSLEHNGGSTVITVITDPNGDQQTYEITDGHEVHHLTIDANGQLQEISQDDLQEEQEEREEILSQVEENVDGEILEEEEINMLEEEHQLILHHPLKTEHSEVISSEQFIILQNTVHEQHEHGGGEHEQTMEHELMEGDDGNGMTMTKFRVIEGSVEDFEGEELVTCSMELPMCFITSSS